MQELYLRKREREREREREGIFPTLFMQPEIKTGFIFLQSCDGCGSHREIISIAEQIILEAKSVLLSMQPGPPVPPNPSEYVAVYEAQVTPTFLVHMSYHV